MTDFTLMGVVNVTPDSFSDGGRYFESSAAIAHGLELELEGAAILDIGGESTRPGADPVGSDEELRRVVPVIEGLRGRRRGADLDRHLKRGRGGGAGGRRLVRERRDRVPRRSRACRRRRERRRRLLPDAHARRPPHDAGRPALRRCRLGHREFLEERLAFALARGIERGSDHARPRDRVRQDARSQPRAAPPPRRARGDRAPGGGRHLAQVVPRPDHRPRAATSGSPPPSPPTCSPTSAAPACSASTMWLQSATPSRWRLLRSPPDVRRRRFRRRRRRRGDEGHPEPEVTIEISGLSLFTHPASRRPSARWGSGCCFDLQIRRRRHRRDRYRPRRGHRRLRRRSATVALIAPSAPTRRSSGSARRSPTVLEECFGTPAG